MISKIDVTALENEGRFHTDQPDCPAMSADEMKAFLDYIPKDVLIPKVNELIDSLSDSEGGISVVETVRDGTWTYTKTSDGECVCYGSISGEYDFYNSIALGTFYASNVFGMILPSGLFKGDMHLQATVISDDPENVYITQITSYNNRAIYGVIVRGGDADVPIQCTVMVTVRGRWK